MPRDEYMDFLDEASNHGQHNTTNLNNMKNDKKASFRYKRNSKHIITKYLADRQIDKYDKMLSTHNVKDLEKIGKAAREKEKSNAQAADAALSKVFKRSDIVNDPDYKSTYKGLTNTNPIKDKEAMRKNNIKLGYQIAKAQSNARKNAQHESTGLTRNELIASIMLEAADLLREDSEVEIVDGATNLVDTDIKDIPDSFEETPEVDDEYPVDTVGGDFDEEIDPEIKEHIKELCDGDQEVMDILTKDDGGAVMDESVGRNSAVDRMSKEINKPSYYSPKTFNKGLKDNSNRCDKNSFNQSTSRSQGSSAAYLKAKDKSGYDEYVKTAIDIGKRYAKDGCEYLDEILDKHNKLSDKSKDIHNKINRRAQIAATKNN